MPTYEYMCDSCSHQFDVFQSMMDDPLKDCPACSTPALRRLISGGTGVIFRGSGFYVNDSRSKGSRGSSSADSGSSSSKESAPAATSSDTTTAPVSSTKESDSAKTSKDSSGGSSSGGSSPAKQSA